MARKIFGSSVNVEAIESTHVRLVPERAIQIALGQLYGAITLGASREELPLCNQLYRQIAAGPKQIIRSRHSEEVEFANASRAGRGKKQAALE